MDDTNIAAYLMSLSGIHPAYTYTGLILGLPPVNTMSDVVTK